MADENKTLALARVAVKLLQDTRQLAETMEQMAILLLLKGWPGESVSITPKEARLSYEYELYHMIDANQVLTLQARPKPPRDERQEGGLSDDDQATLDEILKGANR